MAKRTKAQELDRVRHLTTGETGTIMQVYDGNKHQPPNYGILLDTGPRVRTLWKSTECEWAIKGAKRQCHRCGDETHRADACPYGDCGAHLDEKAREAIVALGLDPRRVPGKVDAPDTYDGIRLGVAPDGRTDVYQPMRRRVCEYDGHEGDDCPCGGA